VVDEHTEPSRWARAELLDDADEIVDATEMFDHHTLDPQIIAPHLLDELGIVAALHVDSPGTGYLGAGSVRNPVTPLGRR
jgi:hypothetical protein